MIKSQYLSPRELDEIVTECITGAKTLHQVIEETCSNNKNLSSQYIRASIKNKIKAIILDIENDLSLSGKIQQLKMYEHSCDDLFQPFLQIRQVLKDEYIQDFVQHYVNMKIKGPDLLKRSLYPCILSDRKMEMYSIILEKAEQLGLFESTKKQKIDPEEDMPPYENSDRVFSPRDQQLVLKAYLNCGGKVQMAFDGLARLNMIQAYCKDAEGLKQKLDNLVLIGMYEIHKEIAKTEKYQLIKFRRFKAVKKISEQFQPHYCTLLRIGIRKDPSCLDLKTLSILVNKKFIMILDNKPVLNQIKTQEYYDREKSKMRSRIKEEIGKMIKRKQMQLGEKKPVREGSFAPEIMQKGFEGGKVPHTAIYQLQENQ